MIQASLLIMNVIDVRSLHFPLHNCQLSFILFMYITIHPQPGNIVYSSPEGPIHMHRQQKRCYRKYSGGGGYMYLAIASETEKHIIKTEMVVI
jgi:hypothetical protein